MEEENDRTIKILIEKFDAYCNPLKNESVERYKFYSRSQQSGETIYNYVTEFKLLAAHCGYGELKESLIRHCIVCGIRDVNLRERLLRETKLTLQNCLEICCASELSKERIKEIDNAPAAEVHAVRNPRNVKFKIGNQSDSRTQAKPKVMSHNCHYCGCKHEYNKQKCPAFGQVCRKCHKKDHFAVMCGRTQNMQQQKKSFSSKSKGQHVHYVEDSKSEDDYYETIKTVTTVPQKHVYATMHVNGKPIKFQVDSGASCNVIPVSELQDVDYKLTKSNTVLTTYNKSEILPLGKTVLKMFNPKTGKTHKTEFIVVEQEATPILGNQSIQNMNLVTINYRNILALKSEEITLTEELIFSEYSDVFEGTGCLPGVYRLETDPSVKPIHHEKFSLLCVIS